MKRGDIVQVYADPVTRQKPEFQGRIMNVLIDEHEYTEQYYCRVREITESMGDNGAKFIEWGGDYNRWVTDADILEEKK